MNSLNEIIVSIISTIIGTIAGIYIKRHFSGSIIKNKVKFATWTVEYFHPLISSLKNLKIYYNKIECENIKETRLVLWNDSKKLINGSDISENAPLTWDALPDNQILDAKVLQQSNVGIGTFVKIINKNQLLIKFSYLEPKDGFVVSIIHSGPPLNFLFKLFQDKQRLLGSIKGFGEVSRIYGQPDDCGHLANDMHSTFTTSPNFVRLFLLIN